MPAMTEQSQHASRADTAVFFMGVWLAFCPPTLALNESPPDLWGTVIAGGALVVLGATAMAIGRAWVEWAVAAWGAVFLTVPWVVGFAVKAAVVNATVCAVAAMVVAALRLHEIRSLRSPVLPDASLAAASAVADERRAA